MAGSAPLICTLSRRKTLSLLPRFPGLLSGLLCLAPLLMSAAFALPQGTGTALRGDKVQCANLTYAGNKTSKCYSDRFLKRLELETHIKTEAHFRSVRLDSRELSNFPFAIMTGEGAFTLTEKDRVQLRYYLTHGGFLLASASCSDPAWVNGRLSSGRAPSIPNEQLVTAIKAPFTPLVSL